MLDAYLEQDKDSRCGIETMGGKGKIFITGEVTSKADVDVEAVVKSVLKDIGYRTDYEIIDNIGLQSPDIAQGVNIGGAGDQGMMFGYACRETPQMLPKAMVILQELAKYYDELCHQDKRFLPDGKAQITGRYDDDGHLESIKYFTISYQNTEIERDKTDKILQNAVLDICNRYGIRLNQIERFYINPTGKFLIGGFEGDAGLTGRKIVVDNYHSFAPVGGGAFSGKDPTKVDRSAAYKARQIAINHLKVWQNVDWCEVQVSYAIGLDKPLAVYIKDNSGYKHRELAHHFEDCTPTNIINEFDLKNVKYYPTAQFGHFGHGFAWEKYL